MAQAPDVVYRGPFRASPCRTIPDSGWWQYYSPTLTALDSCSFSSSTQDHPDLRTQTHEDWYNDYYADQYAGGSYGFVQYAMVEDFYEYNSMQTGTASLSFAPYLAGLPTEGSYANSCFSYNMGSSYCNYPNSIQAWSWTGKFKRDAVELRALSGSLFQDLTGNLNGEYSAWLIPWAAGYENEYYTEFTTYDFWSYDWTLPTYGRELPFLFTIVPGSSVGQHKHIGGYSGSSLPDIETTFTDSQGSLTMGMVSSIGGTVPSVIRTMAKYTSWEPHGGYPTSYVHLNGTSTQILYSTSTKKFNSSSNTFTLEHDGYTWVLTDSTNSRTLSAYLDGLRTSVQVSPISYSLDWKDSGGTTYTNYLVASSNTIITNGKGTTNYVAPTGGSNNQDSGNDSGNNTRIHDAATGVNTSSNTNIQLTSFSIAANTVETYTLFSQGFDDRRTYHVHAYQPESYLDTRGDTPSGDPTGPVYNEFGNHAYSVNVSAIVTDNDTNEEIVVAATGHAFNQGFNYNESFTWAGPLGGNDTLKLKFWYASGQSYPGNKTINLAWW